MRRQLASVPRTYGLASSGARPVVALLLLVCTATALSLPRSSAPQDSTYLTIAGQPEEFSNEFPAAPPASSRQIGFGIVLSTLNTPVADPVARRPNAG